MKAAILVFAAIFSIPAFASNLKETRIATCVLSQNGSTPGTLDVLKSDNGDEGFLRFAWTVPGTNLGGEFTDNVQDEGAAFLKPGTRKLYVAQEGSKSEAPAGSFRGVAIYLKNNDGKISGILKADFVEAQLSCQAVK